MVEAGRNGIALGSMVEAWSASDGAQLTKEMAMADEQSFWQSHRTLAGVARDAERFAVRLPLVGRLDIPRPEQLAYFAGLGLLVALDLIEWPVAVAIGVGQVLVTEHAKSAAERPGSPGAATNGNAGAAVVPAT